MNLSYVLARYSGPAWQPRNRLRSLASPGAVVGAELLFILCRALAQDQVSLDDPLIWLSGLAPFFVFAVFRKRRSKCTRRFLEVWCVSLVVYILFSVLNVASVVEYPLDLRFDVGLLRSFASASIYVVIAAAIVFFGWAWRRTLAKSDVLDFLAAIPTVSACFALTVFQGF